MAIHYQTEVRGNLMKVITSGEDESLEEVMDYAHTIINEAVKANITKVLCDERNLIWKLSAFDTFQLAENTSKLAPRVAKIAIVCNPKYVEEGRFYETVATNRGLIIRVLSDIEEAKKWLE